MSQGTDTARQPTGVDREQLSRCRAERLAPPVSGNNPAPSGAAPDTSPGTQGRVVEEMNRSGQEPLPPSGEAPLVTTCGRQVAVKRLLLAIPERPITRVTLDVGPVVHGEPGLWASLTVAEARDLARRLLAQAALADTGTGTSVEQGAAGK